MRECKETGLWQWSKMYSVHLDCSTEQNIVKLMIDGVRSSPRTRPMPNFSTPIHVQSLQSLEQWDRLLSASQSGESREEMAQSKPGPAQGSSSRLMGISSRTAT